MTAYKPPDYRPFWMKELCMYRLSPFAMGCAGKCITATENQYNQKLIIKDSIVLDSDGSLRIVAQFGK